MATDLGIEILREIRDGSSAMREEFSGPLDQTPAGSPHSPQSASRARAHRFRLGVPGLACAGLVACWWCIGARTGAVLKPRPGRWR